MATRRFKTVSVASMTAPMPPEPIVRSTLNFPATISPGERASVTRESYQTQGRLEGVDETTASLAQGPVSLRGDLVPALVLVWSNSEPDRSGEVALFPPEAKDALVLGRGGSEGAEAEGRIRFFRQRPGSLEPTAPLEGAALSRRQLEIRFRSGGLHVERLGRCPMRVNGSETERALLAPGDVLHVVGQLVLFCTLRPRGALPACEFWKMDREPAFGAPDPFGIV